ncbi:MAG: type 4a pilus biogenesis protein PilO [Actinomycetota bacterium]
MNALRANRRAAVAAIVAGDLLVLLLGWFMLIGPQRAQAKQIAGSTAATEAQIVEASKPVAPVTPAVQEKQPDIRTADLYSLAKAMPSSTDTPDLLLELNLLAKESGVTLDSIAPSAPTPDPSGLYSLVPVSLVAKGDFYSLTDYLYRLRTLVGVRDGALQTAGRLYSVGAIAITGDATSTVHTANFSISAFQWSGNAPAATDTTAVAPSTDTTSTDTTATDTTSSPAN